MLERIKDLPEGVRRALFALIALVLVVMAIYASTHSGGHPTATTPASPTSSAPVSEAVQPTATNGGGGSATASSAGTLPQSSAHPSTTVDGSALSSPLTKDDLAKAAGTAVNFAQIFGSYRYDEDPNAQAARMQALLTSDSTVDPASVVPTGTHAADMASKHTVITATAEVTGTVLVTKSQVVFAVSIDTTTTTTSGATENSDDYNITVAQNGQGGWAVADVQAASADGTFGE